MKIKQTIEKVPGGLMIIPLLCGALLNTIDQLHLKPIQVMLKALGTKPLANGYYEFFRIGGFSEELFKNSALALIALFLLCTGAQMNLQVQKQAFKKGVIITASKYLSGLAVGLLLGHFFDPMYGLFGLSTMTIIAAMTNSNGGIYVALTSQFGNRSDVGAISVLAFNHGPFLTLLSMGLMGEHFPFIAFISVLLPVLLGIILGNLDKDIQVFLKSGESLLIPFFAFALGANMSFLHFLNINVLIAGLFLGILTLVVTGTAGILSLKLFKEKSQIAGVAEASTAGNAVATPAVIAVAAVASAAAGKMDPVIAQKYADMVSVASAQISISTITTALLCPIAVVLWHRYQLKRGVDTRKEY